ncbi:hypothetical protein ES288_A01G051800v1 [Gossypium darwinii]|uniref:Protein kinase domain-containing protein n=1 Tax=Gossypium darwinii TaxID=34276 RepID=A0A5D2HJX7_GOSDA|nr:hypothetical protein ES288_A01G051800v1 [Gossypium darwinii]
MGKTFLNLSLLIIFHFFIMATFSMKLTTIVTDQLALLALKEHVFTTPKICGSKHRRVVALNFTGLGLVGILPPHLGNLSFLSLLSISDNSFGGELPVQLSNLRRLKHINFRNNNFSGEIPSWLGSLPELQRLFLYHNNFKGAIPFSLDNQLSGSIPFSIFNISSLQKINLRNNYLFGSIPSGSHDFLSLALIDFTFNNFTGHIPSDMFDHLPNLKNLGLSYNMLSGKIPASLCKCKELQILSLSYNQFGGNLPIEIGNLSMLQMLLIGDNNFEGEIPEQVGNLTLLMMLDAAYNNLTGTIPHQIGNLKHLKLLNLGVNNVVGSIPPAIFNSTLSTISLELNHLSGHLPSNMGLWLPNLENLYLGENQLHGSFSKSVCNASQLTNLDVSHNYFSGSIPNNLGNLRNLKMLNLEATNLIFLGMSFLSSLTNCRGLEFLIFSKNPLVSGELPGLVGNLSGTLQRFYASACSISGIIPSEIGNLSRLISIELVENKLTGTIPTTIGGLKELQSLSLENNKLEGSIPFELCHLNKLAFLLLTNNKLSGPIPACLGSNMFSSSIPSSWKGLNNLLILNLSYNSLSGPLPIDMGKWKALTSMDLSNNQFSNLTHFSLSNNRITGSIPESFGDLLSLEFLDLSRNNLSGEIPNVSFNRLQGEIPKGGSFGNYSIESFKGNEAFCKTRPLRNSKVRTKLIIFVTLPIASAILRKDRSTTQEDSTPLGTWRRISYHELHQATNGFSDRRLLGNGSYGSVYQGTLLDGMEFAVKVFKLELEGAFKSFDVECEILRNIRHRNLIKIINLVLEFMSNGSLDKWLYSNNHSLDILQRLNIMIDVASACIGISPSCNVLLDEDMVAHLSDFGIAKLLCEEDSMIQTMTMATIGYMAPEYGTAGIVSTKGDVYSFGILMMETITRKKPTNEMFEGETSLRISNIGRKRSATDNCALSILQVGLECSVEAPDERLDMKETVTKLKKIKVKLLEDIGRVR